MNIILSILLLFGSFINLLANGNNQHPNLNPKKNILILHSYHETSPWVKNIQKGIEENLNYSKYNINLYVENMDTKRFNSKQWYRYLKELYSFKYKDIKLDAIISSDNNAFNFLKKYRDKLFGDIPVSFCGVNFFTQEQLDGYHNYTGVAENEDFDANVKLMKKINPNLKKIYITGDYLPSGILVKKKIKELVAKNNYGVEIEFSPDVSFDEMLQQIGALKTNTYLLYGIYFQDNSGTFLSPSVTSKAIVDISNVPVFTMFDLFYQNGVLGGNMVSSYAQGAMAAKLVNRILDGEDPSTIDVVMEGTNENIFDFHAMDRYDIDIEDLPKNSKITNKDSYIFTKDELNWIVKHPIINVGGEIDWKPFDFVNQYGEYDGITNDILNLISKKSGLKFNIETKPTWSKLVKSFKDGKIDILPAIYYSKDRRDYGLFTLHYINIQEDFFVLKDSGFRFPKDLKEARFSAIKGYKNIKQLKQIYPNIKVTEVDNIDQALELLLNKQVDAFLGGKIVINYILKEKKINNIKSIPQSLIEIQKLRMLVNKEKKYLYSIINKSLKNITDDEIIEIKKRWSDKKIFLTNLEKEWVQQHQKLKIAIDPNFLPFSGYKNGEAQGISVEILNNILSSIGIEPQYIKTDSWSGSLEAIKSGKADLLTTAVQTQNRKKYMRFTYPTVKAPRAIVVNKNNSSISSLDDINGKTIGLIKDSAVAIRVLNSSNPTKIIWYSDIKTGLKDLEDNKIELFVDNFYVLAYIIKEEGFNNIKIVNKFDLENNYHIASSKQTINNTGIKVLNKALLAISKAQKSDIIARWSNITVTQNIDYTVLYKVVAVFVVLILFGLYWTRKLDRAKKEAQDAQEFANSIMNSQENFVLTTDGSRIRSGNKAFLDFYKVKDIKQFRKKYGDCICETFSATQKDGYITKFVGDKSWIDYVLEHKKDINKVIIQRDKKDYIFKITVDEIIYKDEKLKTAVFSDITQIEAITEEIKEIHKHVRESIEYASHIQGALIPNGNVLRNYFQDSFVFWSPKDTVGGDIWLFDNLRNKDECLLFFIDCTGHGVPGAFVTMIVKAIEREVVVKIKQDPNMIISTSWIMNYFNNTMKILLKQEDNESISNAGWDGGIIYYNKKNKIVKFSGAETPLFYTQKDGELKIIKGDRYSVGYKKCRFDYKYTEHIINVEKGMKFYCTTDGYIDQNGGDKSFPFGKKRFKEIIKSNYQYKLSKQKDIFIETLLEYQGDEERNDDITLIGFEI